MHKIKQEEEAVTSLHDLSAVDLIAVSGYGQAQDIEKALAAGFDHHITKPCDPELLRRLLAEHHLGNGV